MLVSVGIDSLEQIDGVWLYAAHRKVVYQLSAGIVVLEYQFALGRVDLLTCNPNGRQFGWYADVRG